MRTADHQSRTRSRDRNPYRELSSRAAAGATPARIRIPPWLGRRTRCPAPLFAAARTLALASTRGEQGGMTTFAGLCRATEAGARRWRLDALAARPQQR